MRVLVPGGAGYIGSFTVRELQRAGHEVVVFDNLVFGHRDAVDAELVIGDLADTAGLDSVFERGKFDAVVHFAAFIEAGLSMEDAGRFFENNTGNSIRLLNAMVRHGVNMLVFSSSAAVYGDPVRIPVRETDDTNPVNVYGETKLLIERMLPWYERVHGIRSVALRYFNATGAALDGSIGQDHQPATHLITVAIMAILGLREKFVLFGDDYPTPDGTCIRDYIHVIDLAEAHLAALSRLQGGCPSETFNVGTGSGHSNWEVINAVKRTTGVDLPVEIGPRRPGDPAELVADASKLRKTLDWEPRCSDLDTIVGSAWKWHCTHEHGYEA
ncbi:MAG TPA: UDP-glucose 4-epimerase GalE [Chloroflexi bacterium]|nr:UDP-glucose 4-epimerase GalE [Chloroflexota bacterium]